MAESWRGVRLAMASDPRYLEPVRAVMRDMAQLAGLDEAEVGAVELAVQEALANVIRHCYKNVHDQRVDMVVTLTPGTLEVRIDDYGEFVEPERMPERDLGDVRPGGLGLPLMRKAMDRVTYRRNRWGGTTLTLSKRRKRRKGRRKGGEVPGWRWK